MKKIIIASVTALTLASTLAAGVVAAKCAGCHGKSFEKKAMGKSKIVSEMELVKSRTVSVTPRARMY